MTIILIALAALVALPLLAVVALAFAVAYIEGGRR